MDNQILKKLIDTYKLPKKEHSIVLEKLKKSLFESCVKLYD